MKSNHLPVQPAPPPAPRSVAAAVRPARPAWSSLGLDQRIIHDIVDDNLQGLLYELSLRGVTEATVRAHARSMGLTDGFIKECRLSGSRPALRACIKCDAMFLSSGIHNRLCRSCPAR